MHRSAAARLRARFVATQKRLRPPTATRRGPAPGTSRFCLLPSATRVMNVSTAKYKRPKEIT